MRSCNLLHSENKPGRSSAVVGLVIALSLCLALTVQVKAAEDNAAEVLNKFGTALSQVAEQVKPAVVNISTSKTVKSQKHPFLDDPFFRRFFGDGLNTPQKRKVTNLGSGVIASPDGYILTNNHVIEGAEDILVKLSSGKEYKGKVIGSDARTDIAVIKINETKLPIVKWADSDKLRVGEIVLAVGNPFGLNQTITMGIISALGRSGIGITDYEDFIQTDAAINPGNSGGALVNVRGEIIGINTAIFSTSGGYQGIGFAIPSNMVRNIMDSIINQGKVVRGWLGVQIQPLSAELAKQFNIKDEKGIILTDIVEGGPAEKAGLKRGDIIVEYDGKKIETPFALKNMVGATKPSKEIAVKIFREGVLKTITVKIEELKPEAQMASAGQFDNGLKGVSVQDATEEILRNLGIQKKIKGTVVTNVDDESPASGVLTKGDVITEINRKPIASVKEYNDLVSKILKNDGITLLIIRNGSNLYVTIPGQ